MFAHETAFFIEFTRRWWLDLGFTHPLFSPFMEFEDTFTHGLFDLTEAFVSPCSFNENWCGGVFGMWTPKIGCIGGKMPNELQ